MPLNLDQKKEIENAIEHFFMLENDESKFDEAAVEIYEALASKELNSSHPYYYLNSLFLRPGQFLLKLLTYSNHEVYVSEVQSYIISFTIYSLQKLAETYGFELSSQYIDCLLKLNETLDLKMKFEPLYAEAAKHNLESESPYELKVSKSKFYRGHFNIIEEEYEKTSFGVTEMVKHDVGCLHIEVDDIIKINKKIIVNFNIDNLLRNQDQEVARLQKIALERADRFVAERMLNHLKVPRNIMDAKLAQKNFNDFITLDYYARQLLTTNDDALYHCPDAGLLEILKKPVITNCLENNLFTFKTAIAKVSISSNSDSTKKEMIPYLKNIVPFLENDFYFSNLKAGLLTLEDLSELSKKSNLLLNPLIMKHVQRETLKLQMASALPSCIRPLLDQYRYLFIRNQVDWDAISEFTKLHVELLLQPQIVKYLNNPHHQNDITCLYYRTKNTIKICHAMALRGENFSTIQNYIEASFDDRKNYLCEWLSDQAKSIKPDGAVTRSWTLLENNFHSLEALRAATQNILNVASVEYSTGLFKRRRVLPNEKLIEFCHLVHSLVSDGLLQRENSYRTN